MGRGTTFGPCQPRNVVEKCRYPCWATMWRTKRRMERQRMVSVSDPEHNCRELRTLRRKCQSYSRCFLKQSSLSIRSGRFLDTDRYSCSRSCRLL